MSKRFMLGLYFIASPTLSLLLYLLYYYILIHYFDDSSGLVSFICGLLSVITGFIIIGVGLDLKGRLND